MDVLDALVHSVTFIRSLVHSVTRLIHSCRAKVVAKRQQQKEGDGGMKTAQMGKEEEEEGKEVR